MGSYLTVRVASVTSTFLPGVKSGQTASLFTDSGGTLVLQVSNTLTQPPTGVSRGQPLHLTDIRTRLAVPPR